MCFIPTFIPLVLLMARQAFAHRRPQQDLLYRRQVETIGDAYMVVSGAPEKEINHAEKVCDMALDMVEAITDLKDPSTGNVKCQ